MYFSIQHRKDKTTTMIFNILYQWQKKKHHKERIDEIRLVMILFHFVILMLFQCVLCYFSGNLWCILFFSIYFLVILGAILIVFGFNWYYDDLLLFLISLFIFGYIYFISNIYIITIVLYIYIYSARHFESVIYYIYIMPNEDVVLLSY